MTSFVSFDLYTRNIINKIVTQSASLSISKAKGTTEGTAKEILSQFLESFVCGVLYC